jgi:O-antigen/teichoic acid export membrane protein
VSAARPFQSEPTTNEPASLRKASSLILLAQVAGNAGFFVAVLALARALGPHDRGVVAFATSLALIVPRVTEFGIGSATTVLVAQGPDDRRPALANAVMFSFAVAVVGAVGTAVVVGPLGVGPELGRGAIAAVAVGILGNALLDCGYAFLLGVGRLGSWTAIASAAPWVYAVAVVGLALGGELTVLSALLSWGFVHLAWGLAAVGDCVRAAGIGQPRLGLLRHTLSLGVRVWIGSLSRFLNFRVDQIILGVMATQASLGVYAVAVNVSEVALYLPGAVVTAAVPAIARARAVDRPQRAVAAFRATLVVTLAIVVLGAAAGAPLLPLVFGDAYDGSVAPYLWLLPGALGFVASGVFSAALLTSIRPVLSSAGPLAALVSGIGLDLLLIPSLGATGAAVAATAAFWIGGAVAAAAYVAVASVSPGELVPRRRDWLAATEFARTAARRLRRR